MLRLIFLFFLFGGGILTTLPSHAQGRPTAMLSDSAAQIARDDTAMAVQRLFRLQRRSSVRGLVLGAVMAGAVSYSLATYRPETTYQRISTVGFAAVGGYGWYQFVTGVMQQWRYRTRQEQRLLGQLDQAQTLPRWVRRQLAPSYFGARTRPN